MAHQREHYNIIPRLHLQPSGIDSVNAFGMILLKKSFSSISLIALLVCWFSIFVCVVEGLSAMSQRLKGAVNIAMTVDGFIATTDGGVDWLNEQPMVEGEDFGFAEFLKSVDVMIMGRSTFDTVVRFGKEMWAYGDLPIYVFTRDASKIVVPDWMPETVIVRCLENKE